MAAQEALRAREQLLHRLAEALPLGVFQVDTDRSIVYANERLAEITCTGPATTVDAQLCTVFADDRVVLDHALDAVLLAGVDADLEVRIEVPGAAGGRLCRMTMRALTADSGDVTGAIVCVADVTESARLRIELEHRATYDALTGCHNRASIIGALETTLASDGGSVGTALVFVDLDGFKAVNDELGHAAGDELLRIVASRLSDTTRDTDLVGRLGGDEFLVVCPRVASLDEVTRLGDRVAQALRDEVSVAGRRRRLRASIGVTWSRAGVVCADVPRCAEAIVAEADVAMYASKREGAGRPVLYEPSLRDADVPA
jgi:diguanylate cyclase (GGDEF)-like protein